MCATSKNEIFTKDDLPFNYTGLEPYNTYAFKAVAIYNEIESGVKTTSITTGQKGWMTVFN